MNYYKNTTQTPNIIFTHLLKSLRDTELRVLLFIIHRTIGQVHPTLSKKRIERAWISQKLFTTACSKSGRAISNAIDSLVIKGYIEVTAKNYRILDTKAKRRGASRLYYASRLRLVPNSKKASEGSYHNPVKKGHTIKLNNTTKSCYNISQGVKKISDTERYRDIQKNLRRQ